MDARMTIAQTGAQLRAGALTIPDLVEALLRRIHEVDSLLNSFLTVAADSARADAERLQQELTAGHDRGPLHGIPIALKDLYETAGIRTTAGTRFLVDHIPDRDAAVVARLKMAGAVILGKNHLHEWALGVISDNPHFGFCRNPWDMARSPGGSSGGSAAALAAGLCLGALGSDTRGSIRLPAALCGVVGLKPSYGRLSLRGVLPLCWSLDHAGPMARTVADVAALYDALQSADPADPLQTLRPDEPSLPTLHDGVRGLRLGVAADDFFVGGDTEITAAFQEAAQVFAGLGAAVTPVDLSFLSETIQTSRVIVSADAAALHAERIAAQPEDFGADVLARLRAGQQMTATEYALARQSQRMMRHRLNSLFEEFDLLLTPTARLLAPRFDDAQGLEHARASLSYTTAPFNMTGHPALSLPCGFSAGGLPIGLQIVGRHWEEALVLRAAQAYESATPWSQRPSPLMSS